MTTITQILSTSESTQVNTISGTGLAALNGKISLSTPLIGAPTIGNTSTGTGSFDRPYPFTGSVTAGTPFTINLNTGNDPSGTALSMVHAGRFHVAHQGSTGKIVVGAGTHPVMGSDQVTLQPGGSCVIANHIVGNRVCASSVSGVSPVEAMPVVDTTGSGTFTLSYMGITTGAITYSATIATLITNINTALDSAFGSGDLVASGASLSALIITGSSGNYQYNAFGGHFTATITGTGFTIGGASKTSTTTTAGVAAISGQQDTITITADCGVVPFGIVALGRSA